MRMKHLFLTLIVLFTLLPLGFAQAQRPIVRLIYFLPSDRAPQPDIDVKMDKLIKDVQRLNADIMESHGFGRKTFRIETDGRGNVVVHHVKGRFTDNHYSNLSDIWRGVWEEIDGRFDTSKNIYLTAIDISGESLGRGRGAGGIGSAVSSTAGKVLMFASGTFFNIGVATHELGHAFGLIHDGRPDVDRNLSDVRDWGQASWVVESFCAADWLDSHRAFNANQPSFNKQPTVQMFPPSFVSPPYAIRLRFKVTDPDGIHQVQLVTKGGDGIDPSDLLLIDYKRGRGNSNRTVEFIVTRYHLSPPNRYVSLRMIDVHGNISWSQDYPIDLFSLLPPPEVVSIPDANLAAAVRRKIGNSITTYTMLNLKALGVGNLGITHLTGLEHAHNLERLDLYGNNISDISALSGLKQLKRLSLGKNNISDISALSGLKQLKQLNLSINAISDVSALSSLKQLTELSLSGNNISDISALSGLKQLWGLSLSINAISDVSALSSLKQLWELSLGGNNISDISALSGLKQLWELSLGTNAISDISALSGLKQLTELWLNNNNISDVSALSGLKQLTELQLYNNNISDISALSGLKQLTELQLDNNTISDVSALSGLKQLTELQLDNNTISDVSALSGLKQLTELQLHSNNISDVSALSGLKQLTELWLGNNAISDVSALSGLKQLTDLRLYSNNISDISVLLGLKQLTQLFLSSNAISDVSALLGLKQLRVLWLNENNISDVSLLVALNLTGTSRYRTGFSIAGNPLGYASINTHIPAMQAKGIEVWFDNVAHPALLKISGDAQEGAAGTTLTTPFVVEAMDESGKPMQGVSVTFAFTAGSGRLSATTTTTDARGRARTTLTLGRRSRRNTVRATAEGIRSFAIFNATATGELTPLVADVNGDGAVNIQDLVLVASRLGQAGENKADVNGDGAVNIQDLVLVAGELGTHAAAPSAWHHTSMGIPTRATVEQWLTQAHRLPLTDARSQRGILLLERLLATLAPKETALLTNYPNPFNPETWIPYHLSKPADVTLTIYSVDGKVVRTLALGHQVAGYYQSKSRAAYWDGRNALGEPVASGVYFYTLKVGDFAATKKLLIRK